MILMLILIIKFIYKYRKDIKELLRKTFFKIKPYLTWHFLLCFGIAWLITNGWCYVFIILGRALQIKWMFQVGVNYLAFLWLPITPEKVVTIPLAAWITTMLFPKDFETVRLIKAMNKKEKIQEEEEETNTVPMWHSLGWI